MDASRDGVRVPQLRNVLNALTTHLLRMAKLESAEIRVRREEVAIPALVDEIVQECCVQLGDHSIQVQIGDGDLAISGDRQLLSLTIKEFIINAAKYSSGNSPITISAQKASWPSRDFHP